MLAVILEIFEEKVPMLAVILEIFCVKMNIMFYLAQNFNQCVQLFQEFIYTQLIICRKLEIQMLCCYYYFCIFLVFLGTSFSMSLTLSQPGRIMKRCVCVYILYFLVFTSLMNTIVLCTRKLHQGIMFTWQRNTANVHKAKLYIVVMFRRNKSSIC